MRSESRKSSFVASALKISIKEMAPSMFKKLKSLFVIEEEEDKSTKPKAQEKKGQAKGAKRDLAAAGTKKANATSSKQQTPQASAPGKVEEKFMNILLKSLEANNLDGFDYLEFKQSLQAIGKIQTDEAVGYQSAFAMASTMGVTVEHLIKTCQHYVEVLETENSNFQVELRRQEKLKIGAEQEKLTQLIKSIADKRAMVEKLQAEIAEDEKASKVCNQRLSDVGRLIAQNQSNFVASFQSLKGQMEDDLVKMKRYLK